MDVQSKIEKVNKRENGVVFCLKTLKSLFYITLYFLLQDKPHLLIYRIAILLEVFGRRESNLKYAYVHFMICYFKTVLFFYYKIDFSG